MHWSLLVRLERVKHRWGWSIQAQQAMRVCCTQLGIHLSALLISALNFGRNRPRSEPWLGSLTN